MTTFTLGTAHILGFDNPEHARPFWEDPEAYVGWAVFDTDSLNDGEVLTLVTGVSGKKIRLLAAAVSTPIAQGKAEFVSSTGPVTIVGTLQTNAVHQWLTYNPVGWGETASGDHLQLRNDGGAAASDFGGVVVYAYI